jgi:hypothetical protein
MFRLPAQYFLGYFTLGCHFLPFLRCISITRVPSSLLSSPHHHQRRRPRYRLVPIIIISQT